MTKHLNIHQLLQAVNELKIRITDNFPESGLSRACDELIGVMGRTMDQVRKSHRPQVLLRSALFLVIACVAATALAVADYLDVKDWFSPVETEGRATLAEGLDAVANLIIMSGAAIWFLLNVEQRLRRRRVLKYLHELRAIAHLVDLQQMTMDPSDVLNNSSVATSALGPYLNYSTDMLALIGKLAALYAERSGDPEISAAASDVEMLTISLTRKIWQKLAIVAAARRHGREEAGAAARA